MSWRISPRAGAGFGLLAILVWLVLYFIAAASLPGYDLRTNQVSDLGNPSSPGAWAFNAACILAGLLFLPFALAIPGALAGRTAKAGGGLLIGAEAFLVLVGVFPEESPNNLHVLVSGGFFILLLISALVLAYPLHESRDFGRLTGYLAGATAAASLATIVTRAEPFIEHITVFLGLLWSARAAGRMWAMGPRMGSVRS